MPMKTNQGRRVAARKCSAWRGGHNSPLAGPVAGAAGLGRGALGLAPGAVILSSTEAWALLMSSETSGLKRRASFGCCNLKLMFGVYTGRR